MNRYSTEFFSRCPTNGVRIKYMLTIVTSEVIQVEHIIAEVESVNDEVFHEVIADQLHVRFGGTQTLVADHHGVRIETIRA